MQTITQLGHGDRQSSVFSNLLLPECVSFLTLQVMLVPLWCNIQHTCFCFSEETPMCPLAQINYQTITFT